MTHTPLSEDIQALVAGYVLGDLDSDERIQFQQLLADHPELAQDISTLKETLSLLPYGLPLQTPAPEVRSRLLMNAQQQAETSPSPKPIPDPQLKPGRLDGPSRQQLSSRVKTRLAAAIAVILGACSVVLAHRVSTLQTRLATTNQVVELAMAGQTAPPESSALTIHPADALLTEQWSGITQVIQDHVGSLTRSQGPVDIAGGDPQVLREKLRTQLVSSESLVAQVPTLPLPQAKLLGGSPCQFSQTKGLRMTYALPNYSPISLYQIDLQGDQFPTFTETYITVKQDDINLVLWRQDEYLYALAADLPQSHLHLLTQVMELI